MILVGMNLVKLNYVFTIATFSNLLFVTLSVWLFPKVIIFQVTTSLAWTIIALQWATAHKLRMSMR